MTKPRIVLISMYGQNTVYVNYQQSIEYKSRCRKCSVFCPKYINNIRDTEICALNRSVTMWLITPTATTHNGNIPERGTGHKIVKRGAKLHHQKTLSDPVFRCQTLNLWARGHSHMAQTERIGDCVNPECEKLSIHGSNQQLDAP